VPRLRPVQLPMEQADVTLSVCRGGETRQQALQLFRAGECRPVDHQVPLRHLHGREPVLFEYVHILRPVHRLPGTAGSVPVVVAGGDEHPGPHLSQSGGQLFPRLPEGAGAVEQIPRQQHQIDALFLHVVRQ
ncbi:NADH:flavin oxidoreductase/NADH oxidase N-terminal domain-containing protein, partial [Dysosmobacter welbionis]